MDQKDHLELHKELFPKWEDYPEMIEVSNTRGWKRIFFWRKKVFKPWRELLSFHIDEHAKHSVYDEIERAAYKPWKK